MSSFFQGNDPQVDYGASEYWSTVAKNWAIKLDGPIEGSSYSAQYNANLSLTYAGNSATSAAEAAASAQTCQDIATAIANQTLGELSNVTITDPQEGDVLVFSSGVWINQAPAP